MGYRKTIPVEDIRNRINSMLEANHSNAEQRVALSVLLESILLDTGNYMGFGYEDGNNGLTDHTLRYYYK